MKNKILLLLLLPVVFASCSIGPEPINYGSDACHYCSMTIVDKQHAAEFVTETGKAFKFDAVECMMNGLKDFDGTKTALFLVNGFENPGTLINATKASYLISKKISSPMGENLSAFESREAAERVQSEQTGTLFTWEDLKERFETQ